MRLRPLSLLLAPLWLLIAIALLASCTTNDATPGGASTASVGMITTVMPAATSMPAASLTPTQLKYRILDQYPDFFYCDPDSYPVARDDEGSLARQRFPELQANPEEFQAILQHAGLGGAGSFTDDQKLLVYREHKRLAALHFELSGQSYQFQLSTGGEGKPSFAIQGAIDGAGRITVQQRTSTFATCPICLAAHTRIASPSGDLLVEEIRPGDVVWTLSASGGRVAAQVLKVARVPVAARHILVHLRLDDGRELWASPGHPTADGRSLAELRVGDQLDGARVVLADRVPYDGGATYDLLPAGATGAYWADGIPMGSTLHR